MTFKGHPLERVPHINETSESPERRSQPAGGTGGGCAVTCGNITPQNLHPPSLGCRSFIQLACLLAFSFQFFTRCPVRLGAYAHTRGWLKDGSNFRQPVFKNVGLSGLLQVRTVSRRKMLGRERFDSPFQNPWRRPG